MLKIVYFSGDFFAIYGFGLGEDSLLGFPSDNELDYNLVHLSSWCGNVVVVLIRNLNLTSSITDIRVTYWSLVKPSFTIIT